MPLARLINRVHSKQKCPTKVVGGEWANHVKDVEVKCVSGGADADKLHNMTWRVCTGVLTDPS